MKRAVLVSMPFGSAVRPSIGLGLLKAALVRDGLPCDVQYFDLRFAARIGLDEYECVGHTATERLLGDWVFAADLFGDQIPPPERYFADVWHSADGALPGRRPRVRQRQEIRPAALRPAVGPFLEECLAALAWEDVALVGFTLAFQQSSASLALARRLKGRYPHLAIVLGGPNCEGEMGVALHRLFPFVDYVCSGEGDLNFPLLARHLLRGEPVGDVPGIIRRVDGQTVEPTVASAPVRDLDALPVPDYDDFMQQRVACGLGAEPNLIFPVETARGCWWGEKSHCTFCGLNGSTMQFRSKSVDRALREFAEIMERYDTGRLTAVDNILDMRYFHDLLPRLAALDLPLEIFYETKANLRREQVRLLREAGVAHIQPGIESLSDNVLRLMRKGVTALQNVQLLRWCAEYMVHPMWNVLAGFPGEDPADYARQAALVPLLSHLSPPELGRVIPVRLDRFSPLFVDAAAMGVQNARAAKAYDYVYPFAADDLAKLAYYFRFDYADGRTVGSYVGELNEALATWSRDAGRHHLIAVRDGDSLVIYDTRAVATRPEHRLQGLHRAIYTYCGEARTHAQIAAYCATLAPPLGAAADVDRPLRELEAAKLILALNGRYLSLAVSADYWIDCLAARHGRGRPVPASMQPALRALLDPRLPVANALFAAQVLAQSQPLSGAGSGLLA